MSGIADRLKKFEKKDNNSNHASPSAAPSETPPIPSARKNKLLSPKRPIKPGVAAGLKKTSFMDASDSSLLTVPDIVDMFQDQINMNEAALAQEAADKLERKKKYQTSKRKRKTARTRKHEKKKKEQSHNHYSLLTKGNNATATGVIMNAKTSFQVDPKTYKPPAYDDDAPITDQQKKLLLNVLANNVLFTSSKKDTTTPKLKEALMRAFESVKIRKGETVEEALRKSGSQHHDDNCLYVIEEGEMELNDERGNTIATAVAGDTFGELHTIVQPTVSSSRRKTSQERNACLM